MYSVVLLAALTASERTPAHGLTKHHYGVCYGMCYGTCYEGWPHSAGGWGHPYGGYWAGYACYGACGGYNSYAYGMHAPTLSPAPTTYAPIESRPADKEKEKDRDRDRNRDRMDDKEKDRDPDALRKKKDKDDDDKTQARARVTFDLPRGAVLYVDNHLIANADERKNFRTPVLNKGEQYYYELRAELVRDGKKHVETKRVTVSAGVVIKTDFSRLGTPTTGVATVEPPK